MSIDTIIIIALAIIGVVGSIKKNADKAADKGKNTHRPSIFSELEAMLKEEEEANIVEKRVEVPHTHSREHINKQPANKQEEVVSSTIGYTGVQSSIVLDVNEGFEHEEDKAKHHIDIDANKLIIYSELMRPKWNEF